MKNLLNLGETPDAPGTENRILVKKGNLEAQVFLRAFDRADYRLGLFLTPKTLSRRLLHNLLVLWTASGVRLVVLGATGTSLAVPLGLTLAIPMFLFLASAVLQRTPRSLELVLFFLLGVLGASI